MFSILKEQLTQAMSAELPGAKAHARMMVPGRKPTPTEPYREKAGVKRAAVLALLYPINNHPHIILTLRKQYPGVHSGQISLPGGKIEDQDKSLVHTALREAEEEVGIQGAAVEVVGSLTELYIPPSNFLVQPVVALSDHRPDFIRQEEEVEQIIELELARFGGAENIREKKVNTRGFQLTVPAYDIDGHIIWGATAMIMSELTALLY